MSEPWPLPSVYDLHQRAIARARAAAAPRVLVFGDQPADDSSRDVPYLIVDPDPGFDEVSRGDGRTSSRRARFDVRCCGSSPGQAALALDACRDIAFRDWRPFPDDRRFGAVVEADAGPLIDDDSIPTDVRFSFTVTYELSDD